MAVSRVFAAEANTEHVVFLRSELLQEIAYACERESLDTKSNVDCGGARHIISLCSTDRKHLPCK